MEKGVKGAKVKQRGERAEQGRKEEEEEEGIKLSGSLAARRLSPTR